MSTLDTLGEKIKRRISTLNGMKEDVESERRDIGADLRKIWNAFSEAKKNKVAISVNGAKSKTEYAAFLGVEMRYCQYLVKDGSRKGQTRTTVRYAELLKELITTISTSSPKAVINKASAICDQIEWLPPDWKKEEEAAEREAHKKGGKKEEKPTGTPVGKPIKIGLGLSASAQELEETLDSIEPIAIGDEQQDARQREQQCDYTEEEVAQMFAKGGN